jgi:hypothetical protein
MNKIQNLLNAQVDINRAVFEHNRRGDLKPSEPRPEYILKCVILAIQELRGFKNANRPKKKKV